MFVFEYKNRRWIFIFIQPFSITCCLCCCVVVCFVCSFVCNCCLQAGIASSTGTAIDTSSSATAVTSEVNATGAGSTFVPVSLETAAVSTTDIPIADTSSVTGAPSSSSAGPINSTAVGPSEHTGSDSGTATASIPARRRLLKKAAPIRRW